MKTSAMYKSILSTVAFVSGYLMLAAPAVAQQNSYAVTVPFAFSVGNQTLPAGEYRVGEIGQGPVVMIRGVDNSASTLVIPTFIARQTDRGLEAKLVFHQYGSRRFLSEVWFWGSDRGTKLSASQAEIEYAKLDQEVQRELLASTK